MNRMQKGKNFITEIIDRDLVSRSCPRVRTRFPPEPNGYLHLGHAKSICLNFEIAKSYHGLCNLRFDDTNPTKEESEYVKSIKENIKWLGFDWGSREYYASDYFDKLYAYAVELIKKEKAYVCGLTPDQIKEFRGTLTKPGKDSPYRSRSVEQNLELFEKMKKGEFPEGSKVLRAKIDMASPNLNLRDPVMYRILKQAHHRTADKWCIYPTYDWAHGLCDSIEKITYSLCTLEFENHRPLYDWFLKELGVFCSQQIEFARLNISHTVLSKRKLFYLVEKGYVEGWNDPRMPTLSGLKRRGYTSSSIRKFCDQIGVAKFNSIVELGVLENSIRNELNKTAPRVMGVLNPLKVTITNYSEDKQEELEAVNNPENLNAGTREVPFSNSLYIERDDFMEEPVKKFYRLTPGREVRLRYAYFIRCNEVIKDGQGRVVELKCSYDPETKGGAAPDGRKVKGTLHWVSAKHAKDATIRLYQPLFTKRNPNQTEEGKDFTANLNPDSVEIIQNAKVESSLTKAKLGQRFQFERKGYFCVDSKLESEKLIFNRIVSLRDTWAKIKKQNK
ncbi:MAG: glutamine--tRNA ligase/YqeY domain fusion protein [Candidatus Omnitrophica bacterium]|nr:glutamine--tRNA ligase/YqeY domain fusion protein [Candidatus Omnitrophota bacterium]